jgi:deoxyinosine 3'endonuclease (endonuclease V)
MNEKIIDFSINRKDGKSRVEITNELTGFLITSFLPNNKDKTVIFFDLLNNSISINLYDCIDCFFDLTYKKDFTQIIYGFNWSFRLENFSIPSQFEDIKCNLSSVIDLNYPQFIQDNIDVIQEFRKYEDELYDYDIFLEHFLPNHPFLSKNKNKERAAWTLYVYLMEELKKDSAYIDKIDLVPYFVLQDKLVSKLILNDELPLKINYIAGVSVAYNDFLLKMVAVAVILDANTFEVIEKATHEIDITFHYIPELFSFREIEIVLEAFKKLSIKPDLIICDGIGIAHPRGMGLACHIGIEFNTPTIGCSKKRLVGQYDENDMIKIYDQNPLTFGEEVVGSVLKTDLSQKPIFVTVGHKVSLKTAVNWIIKLTPKASRLPITTIQTDAIMNEILKNRTVFDYFNDDIGTKYPLEN